MLSALDDEDSMSVAAAPKRFDFARLCFPRSRFKHFTRLLLFRSAANGTHRVFVTGNHRILLLTKK
jgi:hypothetical protein